MLERRRPADWKSAAERRALKAQNAPQPRRGPKPHRKRRAAKPQASAAEVHPSKRRTVSSLVKVDLDSAFGRYLPAAELPALIASCGLPENYPRLSAKDGAAARMKVLRGWFDPDKPGELISDHQAFLRACRLWREFYLKPAEVNRGVYLYRDPTCLEDMIRAAFSPPLEPGMPSRCALAAARQLGKTRTLVHDIPLMIGVCRPWTRVLLAQLQGDRTAEELRAIKYQVQENERIQEDFGGRGELYPGRGSTDAVWTSKHLQFIHHYGTHLMGYSVGVSQRGRGPILIVVDDVDTGKRGADPAAQRSRLIDLIFRVFLKMLKPGAYFTLLGSLAVGGSCIELALRGLTNLDGTRCGEDGIDHRFDGWVKARFGYMRKDADGQWAAVQPERYSVETIQRELENDYATTMAEWMCESVTPGERAFSFHSHAHGYMHCMDDAQREYMLDLHTWERKPWDEFVRELRVVGAGDIAAGRSAESDCCASVFIGADAKGIIFVLDVFNRRCSFEEHVQVTYQLAEQWDCLEFGWEVAALQSILTQHMVEPYIEKLKAAGKTPPVFREMQHEYKKKVIRTLALSPLFSHKKIRFLHFDEVVDPGGARHKPVSPVRRGYYDDLKAQIREYTDKGLSGLDDACDGLEMAVRLLGGGRGEAVTPSAPESPQAELDRWAEVGVKLPRTAIPPEKWPAEWIAEAKNIMPPKDQYCAIAYT